MHRRLGWKFWAFISGGAALGEATEEFWRRLGYVVIQGYGMTETTSLISVNHPFKLGRRSIGKVLPGREMKLADDGEILVRGENIARSYRVGQATACAAARRRLAAHRRSGRAWMRAGNLYFKGRKKNVIVTPEGLNVYPEDVEAALRRQPEVRDCVVVGLAMGGNAVPAAALIPTRDRRKHAELEGAVARANDILVGCAEGAPLDGLAGGGFSAHGDAKGADQRDRGRRFMPSWAGARRRRMRRRTPWRS